MSFELLNVDKSYGGRGIASMLVEQSCKVARDQGFTCLVVETTGETASFFLLIFSLPSTVDLILNTETVVQKNIFV